MKGIIKVGIMNIENKTKNKDRQGLEIARTSERPTDTAGVTDQTGTMEGIK